MKKIIRKILKEDRRQEYLNKIIKVMKNDFPIIKNLKDYGFYEQLSEEELIYVFSGILEQPVKYSFFSSLDVYDDRGNEIYSEDSDGYWVKYEFDENGNNIYYEDSDGHWYKKEYDKNGNEIYYETSMGNWRKYEYDERGNVIYYEDSDGYIEDGR